MYWCCVSSVTASGSSNTAGRSFVDFYCANSPPVADFIANHDNLRAIVRASLLPATGLNRVALKAMENLAQYIIRASFSQERMTYIPENSKVVPFSLTHKGNFSIVLPIKSKVISKDQSRWRNEK